MPEIDAYEGNLGYTILDFVFHKIRSFSIILGPKQQKLQLLWPSTPLKRLKWWIERPRIFCIFMCSAKMEGWK